MLVKGYGAVEESVTVQRRITQTDNRIDNWKRVHPIMRVAILLAIIAAVAVALTLAHRVMGSEPFILSTYLVGAAVALLAWFWDFRWTEWVWVAGMLVLLNSLILMVLTAQYWLAAGTSALFLAISLFPLARTRVRAVRHNRQ
jgi:hypothetical protein